MGGLPVLSPLSCHDSPPELSASAGPNTVEAELQNVDGLAWRDDYLAWRFKKVGCALLGGGGATGSACCGRISPTNNCVSGLNRRRGGPSTPLPLTLLPAISAIEIPWTTTDRCWVSLGAAPGGGPTLAC